MLAMWWGGGEWGGGKQGGKLVIEIMGGGC